MTTLLFFRRYLKKVNGNKFLLENVVFYPLDVALNKKFGLGGLIKYDRILPKNRGIKAPVSLL